MVDYSAKRSEVGRENDMAGFESLVQLDDLKTTFLRDQPSAVFQFHLSYDPVVDDLMLLYTSNEVESVVFTLDDYVGFLCLPDSLEVVGVCIEEVKFGFLDQHPDLLFGLHGKRVRRMLIAMRGWNPCLRWRGAYWRLSVNGLWMSPQVWSPCLPDW